MFYFFARKIYLYEQVFASNAKKSGKTKSLQSTQPIHWFENAGQARKDGQTSKLKLYQRHEARRLHHEEACIVTFTMRAARQHDERRCSPASQKNARRRTITSFPSSVASINLQHAMQQAKQITKHIQVHVEKRDQKLKDNIC